MYLSFPAVSEQSIPQEDYTKNHGFSQNTLQNTTLLIVYHSIAHFCIYCKTQIIPDWHRLIRRCKT